MFFYYLAGYPVSGKIIGRISSQISIRYNPNAKWKLKNIRVDFSGPFDII